MLKSYISIQCYKQHSIVVFIGMRKIYTYFIYIYIYTYYIASNDYMIHYFKERLVFIVVLCVFISYSVCKLFLIFLTFRKKAFILLTCYLYIM